MLEMPNIWWETNWEDFEEDDDFSPEVDPKDIFVDDEELPFL